MRVALQGRVSTDEQAQGKTIETQRVGGKSFALLNEYEVVAEYWEDGISGETLHRPKIQQFLADARAHKFDAVINQHSDRFSRDQRDQLDVIDDLFKLGIKHIALTQPGIENLEGTSRVAIVGMNAMASEFEKIRILERTSSARKRVVNEGNVMTSRPPYGLSYVRHLRDDQNRTIKRGHFVHNEREVENLKLILEWAKSGWSNNKIIKELFTRGIRPRRGKDKWAKSTIQKILSVNLSVYAGTWYYMKYSMVEPKFRVNPTTYPKTRKSSRKLREKDEWMQVQLPPELWLISKEDAEQIRRRKAENRSQSSGNTKYNYLLQRMAYCDGTCQGQLNCDNFHGVAYYRCRDKTRQFPEKSTCVGGSVKCDTLEKSVWGNVKTLILQPDLIKQSAMEFVEGKQDDGVVRNGKVEETKRKKALFNQQLDRVNDAVREGFYSLEEAKEQKDKVKVELSKLDKEEREEMDNYNKVGHVNYGTLLDSIEQLSGELSEVIEELSFEEKKQLLLWVKLRVLYSKGAYSMEGSLPILGSNSRPFHSNNMTLILQDDSIVRIPFKITSQLL